MLGLLVGPTACVTSPPRNPSNACSIFEQHRGWWNAVRASERRWGVAPEIQLAIINVESGFESDARPPRRGGFLFIPGRRPSSARGYAQVINSTWDWYREDTGNRFARRDNFDDAADFVGWYGRQSNRIAGISLSDARSQYFAYHEGHAGYNRGDHLRMDWLLRRGDRVQALASRYGGQLNGCRGRLNRRFLFF